MNKILIILLSGVFALSGLRLAAQSDALYSQFYEVPLYYNPAAAGSTEWLRIRGGTRAQWTGVKNAPRNFTACADMPLKLFGKRIGAGLTLNQESIGLFHTLGLNLSGSYSLKLAGGRLYAGLSVGFFDKSFRGSEVYIPDGDDYHEGEDEGIPRSDLRGTAFDFAIGVWYEWRNIRAGVSMTHANSPTLTFSSDQSSGSSAEQIFEFHTGRTFYFMADSNIAVKNTLFEIIPSILAATDLTFHSGMVSCRARYNKFLTLGVGYRYKDALVVSLGAEYRDFFLAYSYDYPTSAIAKVSSGSHEVWAGYRLKINLADVNRHRHKNIRIM